MSMPLAPLSTSVTPTSPIMSPATSSAPAGTATAIPSGAAGHPAPSFWGHLDIEKAGIEVTSALARHDASVETLLSHLTATGHDLPQAAETWLAAHPDVVADIALHAEGHGHAPAPVNVSADDLSHLVQTISTAM